MKKLLLTFMLVLGIGSNAQTTVTIGTGSATDADAFPISNATPIYRASATGNINFSQSVQLLTESDMATAGIYYGAIITKIEYNKTINKTFSTGRNATLNLYMKNSSATAVNNTNTFANWITGSSNVYSNALFGSTDIPATAGWVGFNLSSPFTYTGGALEIAIDWKINPGSGFPTTGPFYWQYTDVTNMQAAGTTSTSTITTELSDNQKRRYNVRITYITTPCSGVPAPGNTLASATSTTCSSPYSSRFSLQNSVFGTGVTYQWYNNAGAISGATSNTYTTTISAADSYYCAVTCSGNTTNSTPVNVSAPYSATIYNVPYSEDFETTDVPLMPNCTTTQNAGTGNYWITSNQPGTDFTSKTLQYSSLKTNAANAWFYTNGINLTGGTSYRISYQYGSTSGTQKLKVTYGTSAVNTSMTTVLQDHPSITLFSSNTFVDFTPPATGVYYFGFNAYSDANQNGLLLVDNIQVIATSTLTTGETAVKDGATLYPNPFIDKVTISDVKNVRSISVVDLAGRIVKTVKVASTINLAELKSGMYIIKLDYKDGTKKSIKAIKK